MCRMNGVNSHRLNVVNTQVELIADKQEPRHVEDAAREVAYLIGVAREVLYIIVLERQSYNSPSLKKQVQ